MSKLRNTPGPRPALALEAYLLTLTSFDSKFDRALKGESQLTPEEQRGFELFMTENDSRRQQYGADCFHCHGGPLFQSQTFANNGLDANFKDKDHGRAGVTGREADSGKFATPSLRNVALTAPYMHDGRFQTLDEVITHYSSGIKRSATLDPNLAKQHSRRTAHYFCNRHHILRPRPTATADESRPGVEPETAGWAEVGDAGAFDPSMLGGVPLFTAVGVAKQRLAGDAGGGL